MKQFNSWGSSSLMVVLAWPWRKSKPLRIGQLLPPGNNYWGLQTFIENSLKALHAFTSSKTQFVWSKQAEDAFQNSTYNCSCVNLTRPQASVLGGGRCFQCWIKSCAVSRSVSDSCLHPSAFMSRKLSQTELNDDIGNRELLPVKVALEEWRHWLEGTELPFLVCTDCQNL